MKLNGPVVTRLASWPFSLAIRAWMSTLDCRALYRDMSLDPVHSGGSSRIYLFWHESILLPLYLRGHCHVSMLLSQHRDADIVARLADRFGFAYVRGSTFQGSTRALRGMAEHSHTHHLTMTPDGPRGPRRQLAIGPVYLASKLRLPIVCLGMAYQHPWRLNSWDRFAVPKPFSRARVIWSDAIDLPPELDRQGLESWRVRIENQLNDLTDKAQDWANSGEHRKGERRITPSCGEAPTPRRAGSKQEAA